MATTGFVPASTALPASITSPPTVQFTPPPECNDPANNWIVTTSCYLELTNTIEYPDWLTCTLYDFGAPAWHDPSCHIPVPTESPYVPKVTIDGTVNYFSGCPIGYSTAGSTTYPGYITLSSEDVHFDATAYGVECCPTQYNFELATYTGSDPRQMTSTMHDGKYYPLFIYMLPACAATSISQLSGKEIPVRTWSNDLIWDKRQLQTLAWDYEHDTMFANAQQFSYTVFQSTHTCYEDCDSWFTHWYYPNGMGGTPGPWPTSSEEVTPTPEPEPTSEVSSRNTVTTPAETPSQSAPGTDTATLTQPSVSTPTNNSPGSTSPSPTISDADSGDSSSTEVPTSGALGATAPSILAVLMIGIAVLAL